MIARETGWPEHFILWELPFFRFLRYQHCHYRSLEIPCYWPDQDSAGDRFEAIRQAWKAGAAEEES